MQFRTVEDLRPLFTGNRRTIDAFVATFGCLVSYAARKVGIGTVAISRKDVEAELWCAITADNWAMIRKYGGNGSFEGYLKRCLAYKATDLGRKYTSRKKAASVMGEQIDYDDALAIARTGAFEASMLGAVGFAATEFDADPENIDGYHNLLLDIMRQSIEELPIEDRLLIKMAVYDGATVKHIAEVLNLECEGTCYTRKNRIIAHLRASCSTRLEAVMVAEAA